jgi:catechol 2,3-dioxygenase-like lactoylglutathione lyase family enzyme
MFNVQIEQLVHAFEHGDSTRREMIAGLGALVAGAVSAGRASAATATGQDAKSPTFKAVGLNHLALDVTDVNRSRDWYAKHLGMTVRHQSGDQSCFMDCGPHFLALFNASKASMNHYCYSIKGYKAAAAVKTLEAAGLQPTRRENRVYFPDPDGLTVQVAEAP